MGILPELKVKIKNLKESHRCCHSFGLRDIQPQGPPPSAPLPATSGGDRPQVLRPGSYSPLTHRGPTVTLEAASVHTQPASAHRGDHIGLVLACTHFAEELLGGPAGCCCFCSCCWCACLSSTNTHPLYDWSSAHQDPSLRSDTLLLAR